MRRSKFWFYLACGSLWMACLGLVSCGGGGGDGSPTPTPTPTPGSITLFAGSLQSAGAADGQGSAAQFTSPEGVALDKAGNLYVTDTAAHTVRKVTPDGAVTTLAGVAGQQGYADGLGGAARFSSPRGIAIDAAGVLYVADVNNQVIRKITPEGMVSTWVGAAGLPGNVDGAATIARFKEPTRLAFDASGVLYVTDQNQAVRKISQAGVVSTFAAVQGVSVSFLGGLTGIAVDAAGYVYVAELMGTIHKFAPDGTPVLWGAGATDGKVSIIGATDLAVDNTGAIVVAVGGSYSTAACRGYEGSSIEKIGVDGAVQRVTGLSGGYVCGGLSSYGNMDGASTVARFRGPKGLAIDPQGSVWIADTGNTAVRKLSPQAVVSTVAGGSSLGNVDAQGAAARFSRPSGIAVSGVGGLLVSDLGNLAVRKLDSSGAVSTLTVKTGQNSGSTTIISGMTGPIAVDQTGAIFVATRAGTSVSFVGTISPSGQMDTQYVGFYIPAIAASLSVNGLYLAEGETISQLAANGTKNVLATGFGSVNGMAVNRQGTVYASDATNHTINSIDGNGKVTLLAGRPGQPGYQDGAGTTARFEYPNALALDGAGNLYVADRSCTIRKIAPDSTVSTVAGTAGQCSTTLGNLPSTLGSISGLAWADGFLYAVTGNAVVKVSLPTP